MAKVLVVDDSSVDRLLAGSLLEAQTDLDVVYAEDGKEALAGLRAGLPDLIVTDLQMPEVNGLQLVEAVRRDWAFVPVILMTAYGSEDIAVQALRAGAASYVPKKNLAQDLPATVERVLALSRTGRDSHLVLDCLAQTEARFVLPNHFEYVTPLVTHLQNQMRSLKICDRFGLVRVGNALHEILVNAIEHGNLELSSTLRETSDRTAYIKLAEERRRQAPYRDRRVFVTARLSPAAAVYTVRDEGPGFDPMALDPFDPVQLEKTTGRGLLLIRTFMDEVSFNAAGNEITAVKRASPERKRPEEEKA